MAKSIFAAVALLAISVTGCATAPQTSIVDHLPAPNFAGPTSTEVAVIPRPVPPAAPQPATTPHPRPMPTPGIPRDWVPVAAANQWRWIVIHHSATATGGAAAFDKMHKAKGWDELGYHFVIGNGTDTHDGQVEVGSRWPKQKWGAHAKTPDNRYNEYGIGICLVGNFDVTHPTAAQMASVERLVTYLMRTYHIAPDHVLGHRNTKPTECPGRNMDVDLVRRRCSQMLAYAGEPVDAIDGVDGVHGGAPSAPVRTAAAELLADEPVEQEPATTHTLSHKPQRAP